MLTLLPLLSGCAVFQAEKPVTYPYIIAADQSSSGFILIDPNADQASGKSIVWSWIPDASLPEYFGHPSDAKIIRDGTLLLTASSDGFCALIDMKSGKLLHMLKADGNPHSAEMLPDGNIVTASSTGNYLRLFDIRKDPSGETFKQYRQVSAHGAVYDKKTSRLYSCGFHNIISWRYDAEKAELIKDKTFPGPRIKRFFDGHDLTLDTRDGKLLVSGAEAIYRFNQFTGEFTLYSPTRHAKSISTLPGIPDLLIIPTEHWWSDKIRILDASGLQTFIHIPGRRIYKARWAKNPVF